MPLHIATALVMLSQIDQAGLSRPPQPTTPVVFRSVSELPRPVGDVAPLRGGVVADPAGWPASLQTSFTRAIDTPGRCTAALIGPRVMLTAKHCIPSEESEAGVTVVFGGTTHQTECEVHPASVRDLSADFALCLLDKEIAEPRRFLYETVDLSDMTQLVMSPVVLTGFGCTSDVKGAGKPDSHYRIGVTTIVETSLSKPPSGDPRLYESKQMNNLFPSDGPGAPNLCPGDSGGPAFAASDQDAYARRKIVAVNTRVLDKDFAGLEWGRSVLAATGGRDFGAWAIGWTKKNGVEACGLTSNPPRCRR